MDALASRSTAVLALQLQNLRVSDFHSYCAQVLLLHFACDLLLLILVLHAGWTPRGRQAVQRRSRRLALL